MSKNFAAVLLLMVLAIPSYGGYMADSHEVTDASINQVVHDFLVYRRQSNPHQKVFSSTSGNQVSLFGEVASEKQRDEILRVVATIPGVRSIVNRITIRAASEQNWPIIERSK